MKWEVAWWGGSPRCCAKTESPENCTENKVNQSTYMTVAMVQARYCIFTLDVRETNSVRVLENVIATSSWPAKQHRLSTITKIPPWKNGSANSNSKAGEKEINQLIKGWHFACHSDVIPNYLLRWYVDGLRWYVADLLVGTKEGKWDETAFGVKQW